MKQIDPVLLLLAAVMLFLVTALVLCAWLLPANMVLFVTISGLITAASGSFYTRLDPKHRPNSPPNAESESK